MRAYLAVFNAKYKNGMGWGNMQILVRKIPPTVDEIREAERLIKEKAPDAENIVITNLIPVAYDESEQEDTGRNGGEEETETGDNAEGTTCS